MNKKFRVYNLLSSQIDESIRQVSIQKSNGNYYYVEDFNTQEEAEKFLETQETEGNLQGTFIVLPVYHLEMD